MVKKVSDYPEFEKYKNLLEKINSERVFSIQIKTMNFG